MVPRALWAVSAVPGSRRHDAPHRLISHPIDAIAPRSGIGITTSAGSARCSRCPGLAVGRERPRPPQPQGARATVVGHANRGTDLEPAPSRRACYMCRKCPRPACRLGRCRRTAGDRCIGAAVPEPMVTAAAALFEPAAPSACGPERRGTEPESGRFRITVVRAEKQPNGPSAITNVTLTIRSCTSEMTSPVQPRTGIGPSCLRHDGVLRQPTSTVLAVSSPSGPANPARRCAAPSPNSTTAPSWNPAVSRR